MGVISFEGLGPRMDEFVAKLEHELQARGNIIKKREALPDGVKIVAKSGLLVNSKAEIRRIENDVQYTYGHTLNVSFVSVLCIIFLTLIALILYFAKKGSADDAMLSAGQATASRIQKAEAPPTGPP